MAAHEDVEVAVAVEDVQGRRAGAVGRVPGVRRPLALGGEAAVVGTGKEHDDRHPKIRRGVMLGAAAKVIGNIEIGHCARVAAGSVVL